MRQHLLSIVIVSFNTRDLLRRCLRSISQSPHSQSPVPCEVLVVDNASRDGSAEMVETEFPGVRLLRMGANTGFAHATNRGLRESRGDLLLLLNPDTEVTGDALRAMADFLADHPEVAAVGPALVFPDGRPQHGAFRFPSLWMAFFDFFPLNHRVVNSRLNGRYRLPEDGRPFAVDHLLGAAMMMRRRALEDVGLLDDAFFMYCEEVDWCLRARRQGWEVYQVPSARIIHHVGQSARHFREQMLVELHRSRYRLVRKHYSERFLRAYRVVIRLGVACDAARARWLAWRGRLSKQDMERLLGAYRAIWEM